jgi:hypothetical protein
MNKRDRSRRSNAISGKVCVSSVRGQLATTPEIQKWIARRFGYVIGSAWIEQCRAAGTVAPAAAQYSEDRCAALEEAFRRFGLGESGGSK